VGNRSNRMHDWRGLKLALRCLTFNCVVSIGVAPALAAPIVSLRYQVVQTTEGQPTQTNLYPESGLVELTAEQQEFDRDTQTITASGNVTLKFRTATLKADSLKVNLKTKLAEAEGKVSLQRGRQSLYGRKFQYNFDKDSGAIENGRGDVYQPSLVRDLNVTAKASAPVGGKDFTQPLLTDRLTLDSPIRSVRNIGTTGVSVGSDRDIEFQSPLRPKGSVTRLRFQADKVDFTGDRVTAEKVRITNDPFSPPELQFRAERAEFKTRSAEEDEITTSNARITIENGLDLPLPFVGDRIVLNKLGKDPNPFNIGIDADERGGIFIESSLYPIDTPQLRWSVTPQYFIQQAITQFKPIDSSSFGVKSNLAANLGPATTLNASAAVAGINLDRVGERLRAKVDVNQQLDLFGANHTLIGNLSYRDRVYNGSLGYQDIQSNIGGLLVSPTIPLGQTGVNLNYQLGAQVVTARTDRPQLLAAGRANDLVTLNRYQGSFDLNRSFRLWEGKGLDPSNREAYNYSPIPVVPYLQLNTGLRGTWNGYSSGDKQSTVGYNVSIQGQLGNFSRSSFDYTGFNLGYSEQFLSDSSPFLFDRVIDNRILTAGLSQHITGPLRAGIQTSINIDNGQQVSTDYYLEYSRRTYNIILRYNPALQIGSIGFRLNDFDWDGIAPEF
jgi:Protein of unknown function (DUF3769)/LptA/(LptD N-terminal domain) LPS transport protein